MRQSLTIVSLIALIVSAATVDANEQIPSFSEEHMAPVKQPLAIKKPPFRHYWSAKAWDTGNSDFWHSAKREPVSMEKAAKTRAALRLKRQQKARGH